MNRRGFLGAILAAGVAPAVVRYGNIMRVFERSGDLLIPSEGDIITSEDLALDLSAIARRAFPKMVVQIYNKTPFLAVMVRAEGGVL